MCGPLGLSPRSATGLSMSVLSHTNAQWAAVAKTVTFVLKLWRINWIDQFRYIKLQPKTIDLSTRLWGINTEFVGFIPKSLVLRLIALGWILIYSVIYRNWSRERMHMTSWQLHWCSKTMKRRQCWCTKPTVGVQLLFFVNTFVCCNIFAWLSDTYSICEAQSMEFVTLSLRHVKFFF